MARRRETPLGRAVKDGPQVTLTMAKAWNSFPRLLRKSCSATDHGVSNPLFDIFLRFAKPIKKLGPVETAWQPNSSTDPCILWTQLNESYVDRIKWLPSQGRISEKFLNQPKKVSGVGPPRAGNHSEMVGGWGKKQGLPQLLE